MMNPVRTTASWLGGRLLLLLLVLTALVAWDAYRDESLKLAAMMKGLMPDQELVEQLSQARSELDGFATNMEAEINSRLRNLHSLTVQQIDARVANLEKQIKTQEKLRLNPFQKAIALVTGQGLEEDLRNELDLRLKADERDALLRSRDAMDGIRRTISTAQQRERDEWKSKRRACDGYKAAKRERERFVREHWLELRIPGSPARNVLKSVNAVVNDWAGKCIDANQNWQTAKADLEEAKRAPKSYVDTVTAATAEVLKPLDELIDYKKGVLAKARDQAQRVLQSVQKMILKAVSIVVLITLMPVFIKAFWYWCVAPWIEKRPPIRLLPRRTAQESNAEEAIPQQQDREKISAVTQEIRLEEGEELLVHPDYLQSSAHRGSKATKWLLDWGYPITSFAAGMVGLTRIRAGSGETYVVSSRNDPLAEVGLIRLSEGQALVLQPRNLIGVVQALHRPIKIRRRWVFSLSAVITLQFRYLVFEGPGTLLVQGCRGVRVELAGTGRAIDQNATMGFSANLAYAPKRSETFGAYLMGASGLFNDSFSGGPGFFIYEEMPYAGKRSGLTGRGLEGLTDGLLKVVGI